MVILAVILLILGLGLTGVAIFVYPDKKAFIASTLNHEGVEHDKRRQEAHDTQERHDLAMYFAIFTFVMAFMMLVV